ncbi:cellulase [Ranunculus cassubicifolius]
MKKNFTFHILPSTLVVFLTVALHQHVVALPLYTDSRGIANEDGNRVKLACVNWPSHLDSVLAEGLSKKPVNIISKKIHSMGFNCVRSTWPVDLASNESLASMTVENSFKSVGLHDSIPGIKSNNLDFLNLTLIQAFQEVVRNLGDNKLMVILDNHISKPGWCCHGDDGNGFFGDKHFDTQLWIKGLAHMATMFKGAKYVIGLSLRNELRGSRQNVKDWYRYTHGYG